MMIARASNLRRNVSVCAASVAILISGCQPDRPVSVSDNIAPQKDGAEACTQSSVSVRGSLQSADTELAATKDAFTFASSASELAIAHDAAGQPERSATLIARAIGKSRDVVDPKKRGALLVEILAAIAEIKPHGDAARWLDDIVAAGADVPASGKVSITAKRLIGDAVHIDAKQALEAAINLPQGDDIAANYKAVTLRKIANILAKKNDFQSARKAIDAITMSITYYQSMVRSDVARHAQKAGHKGLTKMLLAEAEPIARSQKNGYFRGAALRDIAYSFQKIGEPKKAKRLFTDAIAAAATAEAASDQSRATSRIATRLADAGLASRSRPVLDRSVRLAENIKSATMKGYGLYEIAGSAAFSGEFALSNKLIADIPDSSLGSTVSIKSAARRDLVWGLARAGRLKQAMTLASTIGAQREKIFALARIARLLNNPGMPALPRYL